MGIGEEEYIKTRCEKGRKPLLGDLSPGQGENKFNDTQRARNSW